jgi:Concanavalin A-like lectin/glucanases superfamily
MKKNFVKHFGLALMGLVLASSGGIASAQTNILFTYDTGIPNWTTWYNQIPTFSWSPNDAQTNPASGSLSIYEPFGIDGNGNNSQSVFFSGYNQNGSSLPVNLNGYTNIEFDIMVDPSSTANMFGNYGTIQVYAANPYSTSPEFGQYTITNTPGSWSHVSIPIPAGAGTWSGPAFWFQNWVGPDYPNQPLGPCTYYIDNYKVDVGPPLPKVTTQPVSQEIFTTSSNVTWSVAASGGQPLSYQWYKGTTALTDGVTGSGSIITGSISNIIQITGIVAGDVATNYSVIITNAFGSVTSSVVSLKIVSPQGAYAKAMVTNLPVVFYELNETNNPTKSPGAYDHVGGLPGIYGTTVSNLFNSVTGPPFSGFGPNNGAALFSASGTPISLPPLNLNTNTVTITAWINPATQVANAGIVYSRSSGTTSGLVWAGTSGTLGYNWADNSATYNWQSSGCSPPTNQWSFVALVITPNDATIYTLNTNGAFFGNNPVPNAIQGFAGTTLIGQDSLALNRTFAGSIDDVAIFNYSMTPDQVQNLYFAGVGGPILLFDGQNLSWNVTLLANVIEVVTLQQATSVKGPWTDVAGATSPWPVTTTGPGTFYRLKIQ